VSLRQKGEPMKLDFSLKSLVGGVSIGLDRSGVFGVSTAGLAVRDRNGRYKARKTDDNTFIDVTEVSCSLDDPQCWVVRLPILAEKVDKGDLLVLAEDPIRVLLVQGNRYPGRPYGVTVDGEYLEFQPAPNFLLKKAVAVKVMSVFDLFGLSGPGEPSPILHALMLMSGGGADCDPFTPLLVSCLGQGPGPLADQGQCNPLLFLALAARDRPGSPGGRGGLDCDPLLLALLLCGFGQAAKPPQFDPALLLFLILACRDRTEGGRGGLDALLLALALQQQQTPAVTA
jgi:hypothetical protein